MSSALVDCSIKAHIVVSGSGPDGAGEACAGAGSGTRLPAVKGLLVAWEAKKKSPINDDDSHGICWPLVASITPARTRLNSCSTVSPGVARYCNSCEV